MRRVCFLLKVHPGRLEEYERRHEEVWPEMRAALREAGWHNYSLFSSGDGTIIGYLETDDFDAAREAMARVEVNTRWQAAMAPFFQGIDGKPDEAMSPLREIFHLD